MQRSSARLREGHVGGVRADVVQVREALPADAQVPFTSKRERVAPAAREGAPHALVRGDPLEARVVLHVVLVPRAQRRAPAGHKGFESPTNRSGAF